MIGEKEPPELYSDELNKKRSMIEYEDIVSDRGLPTLYKWITQKGHPQSNSGAPMFMDEGCEEPSAEDIVKMACEGKNDAVSALLAQFKFFVRLMRNLCIGVRAKGIFITGLLNTEHYDFIERNSEHLREEFVSVRRKEWLKKVRLFLPQPPLGHLTPVGALEYTKAQPSHFDAKGGASRIDPEGGMG